MESRGAEAGRGEGRMTGDSAEKRVPVHKHCHEYRECNWSDCIFYDGSDHCWTLVSPFKLRRRPGPLLKDSAERCLCLSTACTECPYFEG